MLLPIKSTRDSLNLDRLDKSFLWAVLLLRQNVLSPSNPLNSSSQGSPYKDWVLIGHNLDNTVAGIKYPILNVRVQLPYNSQGFLANGGNILGFIQEITNLYEPVSITPFSVATTKTIITEPATVTSLEKYIYWSALNLLSTTYANSKSIVITINEKSYPNNYVQIEAALPISIDSFLDGLPYVDCLDLEINSSGGNTGGGNTGGGTINSENLLSTFLDLYDSSSDLTLSQSQANKLLFKEKKSAIFGVLKTILGPILGGGIGFNTNEVDSTIKLAVDNEAIFQMVMSFLTESVGIDLVINDVTNRISIAAEAQTSIDYYVVLKNTLINGLNGPLTFDDTAKKVTVAGSSGGGLSINARTLLTSAPTYYVSTAGDNSNSGLSESNAFSSLDHAISVISGSLDLGVYNPIIKIANGTYTTNAKLRTLIGAGKVIIEGNLANPQNVILHATSGDIISSLDGFTGTYVINGCTIKGNGGNGIYVSGGGTVEFGKNILDTCNVHLACQNSSKIKIIDNYVVLGDAYYHLYAIGAGSTVFYNGAPVNPATVTFSGIRNFAGSFGIARLYGILEFDGPGYCLFSGTATGPKVTCDEYGTIKTGGAGLTYLPGNSNGVIDTGGVVS